MITSIPKGQICQQFDAKMHLPLSILEVQKVTQNATVSCAAPAFVYIEGTHGKKFLCDYHYYYEVHMVKNGYLKPGENIQEFIIDETERVKETFAKNVTTTETLGKRCSLINSYNKSVGCVADAFVKVNPTKLVVGKINWTAIKDMNNISESIFYCNFHFRREYYRYYSNGVIYEDYHQILDERYRMSLTPSEESLTITFKPLTLAEEAAKLKYV
jgi:hypothetical protein